MRTMQLGLQLYGGSLGLWSVRRTTRRPSAGKPRGMACRCVARRNSYLLSFSNVFNNKAFQRFRQYKYHRSISADRPNESSISLRSFRRIFGRRRTWQGSRTPNGRVRSGDIEGRQKETNRIKRTVQL